MIDPAIRWENADNCSLADSVLARLGDSGGELVNHRRDCVIRGNVIADVSGNGIQVGGPDRAGEVPTGCRTANNGMFIEEGSKGFRFESNVIYQTSAEPIRFNQCQRDWPIWRGNLLGEIAPCPQAGLESP